MPNSSRARRSRTKRLSLALACGAILALLASCSPASSDGAKTNPDAVAADEPKAFQVSETPPAGIPGGVLRASTQTDTVNLDPHAVSAAYIQWFGRLVFDNLVYLDGEGRPSPWLAKSWDISPDGLVYTFHLRDDVTFSDGARFDAEAVLVNLEHMRDPETKSPLAGRYIAPYERGEVVDAFTFRAYLREPYAPFLDVLAQSWLAILSPKAIRENPKGLATAPVGSGPFILESYDRQQSLKLVRRSDYHWAPDYLGHVGPAHIERIEIEIIPEALVRAGALAADQHQLTLELPPQSVAQFRADPTFTVSSRVRTGIPNRILNFNARRPPFDDVRVRRALALATDREGIARIIGFGEYRVKTDFLASNTRHYDPAARDALSHDPAGANRLLDEAGWTGRDANGIRTREGKTLSAEFLVTESFTPSAAIVALQSDFRKVGFDLRIVQLPQGQLSVLRYAGDFAAISGGVWHTNTPDALYILHHSGEIAEPPTRYGQNVGGLRDDTLDDLLSRARRSLDDAERGRLYSAAQLRLVELVPAIPVFENQTLIAHHRRLRGVLYDTSHNTIVLIGAWLDSASR